MMPSIPFSLRFCAIFTFALAGCAQLETAPAPLPVFEKREVRIPLGEVKPRELPPEPAWKTRDLPVGADIHTQVKALLAERRQAKGYIKELQAVCK